LNHVVLLSSTVISTDVADTEGGRRKALNAKISPRVVKISLIVRGGSDMWKVMAERKHKARRSERRKWAV
jgi:hypothetical protein